MPDFQKVHFAIFDELERQGIVFADVYAVTRAVMRAAKEAPAQTAGARPELRVQPENPRCANGACEG